MKNITRTITKSDVKIIDVKSGEVVEQSTIFGKVDKTKIEIAFVKKHKKAGIVAEIETSEKVYSMSTNDFISQATIVTTDETPQEKGGIFGTRKGGK